MDKRAHRPEVAAAMLKVTGLSIRFGGVKVLNDLNLRFPHAGITGLIGPNGAGKSTLMNCATGLLRPQRGSIQFDGEEVMGIRPHRISNLGLIRTFQHARGFPRMSVFDHLLLYAPRQPGEQIWSVLFEAHKVRERELEIRDTAWALAKQLKIDHVLNRRATDISGGQKKLLEIGRALMADPRMILLDEPMAGVNPTLGNEIGEHLIRIAEEGVAIVLVEHDMPMIRRLCQHVVVMAEGALLTEGTFDEVCDDATVQEAYLGKKRGNHA